MKCIKNTEGEIRRVSNRHATALIKASEWKYIPKSEWKGARKKKAEAKKTKSKKEK